MKKEQNPQSGQTAVEYVVLMALMGVVIFLSVQAMQEPLGNFLRTISQGFQGVVRYGDRRIQADNVFQQTHPGAPNRVVPRHF